MTHDFAKWCCEKSTGNPEMILQSKHDQIILNCFMAERYVRRVLVEEDGLRDASHIKSTSLSVLLKFNIYTPVLLIVSKWAKN